ncbi:hypothetical protein [Xanthomonas axonopodis]|uniref:hypothetical protein n=1 Tax=Xanthomonas axonopodis TaxID=53413 RepID=UPI000D424C72|nr:hypothetical protein [Xanthomonas axonopodis]PPV05360.1 hypothetical protein XavaCFBP5823_20850 [Xanthomonas axonopodis pv. vasculorum]QKD85162.1 hypothetical protein XAV_10105 [Xanthomonas axonopodis pv. vasculorum]
MDAKELVELAMKETNAKSIREFATIAKVSHVAVIRWLDGTSVPNFEQAAEIAALAKLPIIRTASEVRMHSPENIKHKGILQRIAASALGILLAFGIALPGRAEAAALREIHHAFAINAADITLTLYTLCEMALLTLLCALAAYHCRSLHRKRTGQ